MAIESCDRCHVAKTVLVTWTLNGRETRLCRSCGGGEEIDRPDVAVARRKR